MSTLFFLERKNREVVNKAGSKERKENQPGAVRCVWDGDVSDLRAVRSEPEIRVL